MNCDKCTADKNCCHNSVITDSKTPKHIVNLENDEFARLMARHGEFRASQDKPKQLKGYGVLVGDGNAR